MEPWNWNDVVATIRAHCDRTILEYRGTVDLRLLAFGVACSFIVLSALTIAFARSRKEDFEEQKLLKDSLVSSSPASLFPPQRSRPQLDAAWQPASHNYQATVPQTHAGQHVPSDQPFDTLPGGMVSPTGYTVNEIRTLLNFPCYATLSGVPLPRPFHEFDISKARPRPYRPLRWPYHQTMSLTKMEPDWWVELDSDYIERVRQRQRLYRENGKLVLQMLPGSEHACKELMQMVLQFLCVRYPHYFFLASSTGDRSTLDLFVNKPLGTTTHLSTAESPLHVLLDNVPEDYALMMRNPEDGLYYLRAAIICSSLGWSVDTKIGKKLADIHGPIPDYAEKMRFSMDRYFAKMPVDMPIQRGSWGLEVDQPLFMPPCDPHEAYRDSQDEKVTLDRVHFRVDWQTLRRLPLSGAICFNFKGLFSPISRFADEPRVPALLLKVLEEGKPSIMQYKSTWHVEHVAKPALRAMAQSQVERGMVEQGWDEKSLDQAPFFENWESQWRKEQGF